MSRTVNMIEVSTQHAKSNLSQLLERVEAGDEVVILRDSVPVARLVRVERTREGRRALGADRGLFSVPLDFNSPLPVDVLAAFTGEGE